MTSILDDVLAACLENASSDRLLALLLQPGASAELVQHVRTSATPKETAGLLERWLQSLRRGSLTGVGLPGDAEDGAEGDQAQRQLEKVAGSLFKAAVAVMGADGNEKELGAYPPMLLDHLDLLNFQQLAALLSDICRGVEGAAPGTDRLLQLLPKAAGLLLSRGAPDDEAEEDPVEAAAAAAAGPPASAAASHLGSALHRITHAEWASERAGYAVQIMEALRDVPMSLSQLHAVILKSLSVCSGCTDLAAMPALLRQLMRLAGRGHRALVLRGVLGLFERLEAQHKAPDGRGPSQVLQNVEGTALVIIADAFKYDSALAQELLKSVRASSVAPTPFCLLLLFTLSRQHKLDSQVMTLIKGLVVAAFEWDATRSRSAWLSSLPQLPRPGGQQLRAALLRSVRYSGVGGEVVVPGIMALGAALMGCCPPAEALALVQRNDEQLAEAEAEAEAEAAARRAQRRQQRQQPPLPPPPQQQRAGGGPVALAAPTTPPRGSAALQSALLGIQLLQAAFESHREARPDVLRLCQQALGGTAGGSGGALGGGVGGAGQELALPAVLLLGNLAARHPALLYEHTSKLKDAFQSFLLLPTPVALGLLLGLWPLARSRRDLSDYLVMLLRKVMFAREAASRLVAVRGFLFILLQQLRAAAGGAAPEDEEQLVAVAAAAAAAAGPSFSQASCSQSSLSQMQALASGAGVSLQHELQGFLRRALGQQAAVRAALYDGLSAVLLADPGSRDVVLELVAPQLYRYVAEGRAMPPLHCQLLVGGGSTSESVVLLEPLPSLLCCVRRLVALCRDPSGGDGGQQGPGLLADGGEEEERDVVMVDEEEGREGPGADVAVQSLVRTWDGFARRLLLCEAEHFDLNCSADLNPSTASGATRQLQASCLLGTIEVVLEELVAIATGPGGSESAAQSGERLGRAFELHCRVYELAREAKAQGGSRTKQAATEAAAGSAGDGSGGATINATAPQGTAAGAAAGAAGGGGGGAAKRPRDLCPDLVPAETRPPAMSAACLAKLCNGVLRDGLAAPAAAAEDEDAGPSAHTRLARNPVFQAFVLRSCLNSLPAAATTGGALSDALVECAQQRQARREQREQGQGQSAAGGGAGSAGGGGGGVRGGGGCGAGGPEAAWKPLARPLMLLCQTVLATWSGATKRPAAARKGGANGAGGPAAAAAAAAQRREAAAADSLATLAVSGVRDLLAAAAGRGGLEAVAWSLRGLPIHSQDTQAQVDEADLAPEDVVLARLPHFSDMLSRLMTTSSFKEAAALVEVVVWVARLLPAAAQRAVSDACWDLLHQREPLVTHVGLVRALVAAHVTLRGTDDLAALRAVALHVQDVIGAAGAETQQETTAPGALHEGTGQLAAMEVLRLLDGHLAEGEELLAAAVRGAGGAAEDAALGSAGVRGCAEGAGVVEAGGASGAGGAAARGAAASGRILSSLVESLCRRLHQVLDVLQTVVQTRLGNPQVLECQVEVLIRAYRLLTTLAKTHVAVKGAAATAAPPPPPLSRQFQELVALVHRDLTPPVYVAVGDELGGQCAGGGAGAGGGEDGAGALRLSRAKLKRDAKAYSQLVHAMEDWEKHLLALDKAFKAQGVNLMKGARRSANRDFQITAPVAAGGGPGAEDRVERRRRGAEAN